MKTSGIIRIVAGTLVAALLTWLLVAILSGQTIFHTTGGVITLGRSIFADDDRNLIVAGSGKAAVSEIRQIEVQWAVGRVEIQPGTGTDISFTETSKVRLTDEQTMRYSVGNGKLRIAYCESGLRALRLIGMPAKTLTITIPAGSGITIDEIDVESASAEVSIRDMSADKIELEAASGYVHGENLAARELDVSTVSGEVELTGFSTEKLDAGTTSGRLYLQGKADRVDAEAVSGDAELQLDNVPAKLDIEAVSGRINIIIPESEDGFTVEMETVSGAFRCEHPSVQSGKRYVVGGGRAMFDINTVSGDITIGK